MEDEKIALKDWKRIKQSPNITWKHKEKDIMVNVCKNPAYPIKKGYEVDIDKGIRRVTTYGKREEWSKEKALRFAKNYMQNNLT